MIILGISCSPRTEGNTEILVREALQGAHAEGAETEFFSLAGREIKPCDGCGTCQDKGECHIRDDMQELYPLMLAADGILFGTPVYFHAMTAQAKAAIDRSFLLRYPEISLSGKVGGVIGVAGQLGIIDVLKSLYFYFAHNHMFPADYVIAYAGPKGAVENQEIAMKSARELGVQMVRLAEKDLAFPDDYKRGLIPYVTEKYQL